LQRHQPDHGCGHAGQPALEIGCDDAQVLHRCLFFLRRCGGGCPPPV
jgi:hypothetical protein